MLPPRRDAETPPDAALSPTRRHTFHPRHADTPQRYCAAHVAARKPDVKSSRCPRARCKTPMYAKRRRVFSPSQRSAARRSRDTAIPPAPATAYRDTADATKRHDVATPRCRDTVRAASRQRYATSPPRARDATPRRARASHKRCRADATAMRRPCSARNNKPR